MASRRLLIAGHSHTVALVGPGLAPAPEVHAVAGDPDLVHLAGPWPRDTSYFAHLIHEAAHVTSAVLFGGNEHNAYFLFQPARRFDFVPSHESDPEIDARAELVPEAMIRAKYALTLSTLGFTLGKMRARPGARVAVVGTPPPKADQDYLREILATEPDLIARAAATGLDLREVEISSYALRFKLWRLLQDCLRGIAEEAGCRFVHVPDVVYTPRGGLERAYWAHDLSHANDAYGEIMLGHIRRELELTA